MNAEKLRRRRWLDALGIAKILFDDEGYHVEYLKDLERFLKNLEGDGMYSPKISEDLIPKLYRKAKTLNIPMTRLVNEIVRDALNGRGPKPVRLRGLESDGKRL